MADNSEKVNLVYVTDKSYRIVCFSERLADLFPSVKAGDFCYERFCGEDAPCHNCPISHSKFNDSVLFNKTLCEWCNVSHGTVNMPDRGECNVIMIKGVSNEKAKTDGSAAVKAAALNEPQIDALTGLWRRRPYFKKVQEYIHADEGQYCILAIDIEHFSFFNKWYGRAAGDRLLKATAKFLKETDERLKTLSGYLGGDNFSVVLKYDKAIYEYISKGLTDVFKNFEGVDNFRPVFGGYIINNKEMHVGDMYDNAVIAASRVIGSLEPQICWFNASLIQSLENELKLMPEVQRGIENGEFTFYLQPKCNIKTGKIVGAEALVRWLHPQKGLIAPGKFIPVLEQNGYIVNLDKYVWEEVFKILRKWIDDGMEPLPISVNVSRVDIYRMDVVEYFSALARKYQLPPRYVEVEITESAYIENEDIIKDTEEGFRKAGFSVLIDDFGSGYSSLNMLKDAHADMLKLDMKFLDFDEDNLERGVSIITSILEMAHQIKLPTISEGIETERQSEILTMLGCEYGQGYYFYRPMPIENYEKLVSDKDNVEYLKLKKRQLVKSYLKEITDYFIKAAEVNLQTGEYYLIKNNFAHDKINNPPANTISEYIKRFVDNGVIHPDDVEGYLKASSIENIKEHIKDEKYRIRYVIRYKLDKEYEWVVFEVTIPQGFREDEPWVLFSWKVADSDASNMEDALKLVYSSHHKILKVNLTTDTYEIIHSDLNEFGYNAKNGGSLSEWFKEFADKGNVYKDDEDRYRAFTNLEYLKEYFKSTDESAMCHYRRLINGSYSWVTLELTPSMDYSDENQIVMLYVRDDDRDFRNENAAEKRSRHLHDILKKLGEYSFTINLTKNTVIKNRSIKRWNAETGLDSLNFDECTKHLADNFILPEYREKYLTFMNRERLISEFNELDLAKSIEYKRYYNGKEVWMRIILYLFRDEESGDIWAYELVTDIDGTKTEAEI